MCETHFSPFALECSKAFFYPRHTKMNIFNAEHLNIYFCFLSLCTQHSVLQSDAFYIQPAFTPCCWVNMITRVLALLSIFSQRSTFHWNGFCSICKQKLTWLLWLLKKTVWKDFYVAKHHIKKKRGGTVWAATRLDWNTSLTRNVPDTSVWWHNGKVQLFGQRPGCKWMTIRRIWASTKLWWTPPGAHQAWPFHQSVRVSQSARMYEDMDGCSVPFGIAFTPPSTWQWGRPLFNPDEQITPSAAEMIFNNFFHI